MTPVLPSSALTEHNFIKKKEYLTCQCFKLADGSNTTKANASLIPHIVGCALISLSYPEFRSKRNCFQTLPSKKCKTSGVGLLNKVTVNGWDIRLGHPFGMSGARITNHLVHQFKEDGGASTITIQKVLKIQQLQAYTYLF